MVASRLHGKEPRLGVAAQGQIYCNRYAEPHPPRAPAHHRTACRCRAESAIDSGLASLPGHGGLGRPGPPLPARPAAGGVCRRCRRTGAHALGAGHQRRAPCGHRVRGVGARRRRWAPRPRRGQRCRRRLPDPAGPGRGRAARARAPHRADTGRRVGHRDATRPPGQDGVVLVDVARRGRPAGRAGRRTGVRDGALGRGGRGGGGTAPAGPTARRHDARRADLAPARRAGGARRPERGHRRNRRARNHSLRQRHRRGAHGLAPRLPRGPVGPRAGARRADGALRGGLRELRAIPGRRPRGTAPGDGHQARRRVGGPDRSGPEHVRPPSGGSRRGRHLPLPRRPEAAALVGAHERAARDPGRRAHRRPSGRTAAVDARAAPRLGRDHTVGPLGEPGPGVPAGVDPHAGHRPRLRREKALDPTSGSEGLPRWVVEHSEPIWVPT